ncbi:MAG: type VI secretion system-associated FHA domain protein TagH [Paracoccaceae bacterium]
MLLTLRFQSTGTVPGSARPVSMRGASLTIGRGEENNLVLPDPDRMISKRHCVIEDHGNSIVVIDISTNGTFLNYAKTPLGKVPTPLNDGDILLLGTYELLVEIKEEAIPADPVENIAPPLEEGQVSHGRAGRAPGAQRLMDDGRDPGDFLDDLLGPAAKPAGPAQLIPEDGLDDLAPLVPEDEGPLLGPEPADPTPARGSEPDHKPSTQDFFAAPAASGAFIPDDWDDDLAQEPTGGPPPGGRESGGTAPGEPAAAPPPPPPRKGANSGTGAGAPAAAAANDAALAFLRAAGAGELDITAEDLPEVMERLGTVMQALITGIREILMTRAAIKSEFRMNQTMIGAGHNNPLKFSVSAEQAIEMMVKPPKKGYLDPVAAANEALRDVKAHEIAMVTGMQAALEDLLRRLDPAELEQKIETGGGLGNLLKGKKARYWEVYEKMYAEISDQAENDFHELFSKEFARAYQEQLKKL